MRGTHHQEGRVAHATGRGNDLSSSAEDWLLGQTCVEDTELDVPHSYMKGIISRRIIIGWDKTYVRRIKVLHVLPIGSPV